MKNRNIIFGAILSALVCFPLLLKAQAGKKGAALHSLPYQDSTQRMGTMRLLTSSPGGATPTQHLAGMRSLPTAPAASTQVSAQGRSTLSTRRPKYGCWRGGAFIQRYRLRQ